MLRVTVVLVWWLTRRLSRVSNAVGGRQATGV